MNKTQFTQKHYLNVKDKICLKYYVPSNNGLCLDSRFNDIDMEILCDSIGKFTSYQLNALVSKYIKKGGDIKDSIVIPAHDYFGEPKIVNSLAVEALIARSLHGSFVITSQAEEESQESQSQTTVTCYDVNNNNEEEKIERPLKKQKVRPQIPIKLSNIKFNRRLYRFIKPDLFPVMDHILFDQYQVLKLLGLETEWSTKASLLLIPVHGPSLHSSSSKSYDTALRDHWSLLCYCLDRNEIYHYDTLSVDEKKTASVNTNKAHEIIEILKLYRIIPEDAKFFQPDFIPRQNGGLECGHYVILWMILMIAKYPNRPLSNKDFEERYKYLDVTKVEYMKLLCSLISNELKS